MAHSFQIQFTTQAVPNSTGNRATPRHAVVRTSGCNHPVSGQGAVLEGTRPRPRGARLQERWKLRTAVACAVVQALHPPQQPAQPLLYDRGHGVEEGVRAAHSQEHQEAVRHLVGAALAVLRSLAAHQVSEAHRAERHEAEVQGLQVGPALHGGVKGGGGARDQRRHREQDERDLMHGRRCPSPRAGAALLTPGPGSLTEAGPHDVGEQRYRPFQEQVEEEDGGRAAEQAVENQQGLPRRSGRRRHPESWEETPQR